MKKTIFLKLPGLTVVMVFLLTAFSGTAYAQTAEYNLRAASVVKTMPDGTAVTMWGFALVSYDIGAGLVTVNGPVTVPGPRLTVPAGFGLRVNLRNETPQPVSIMIPGQSMPLAQGASSPQIVRNSANSRITSFTHVTPAAVGGVAGGPVAYLWNDLKPGTYLYHSGTHPAVQVQMGLYGAMTKNETEAVGAAPARAYAGAEFDRDVVLLYGEIDPTLHAAVAGGTYGTQAYPSTMNYKPEYFLVNGEAADETAPVLTVAAGTNVLVRFLNAGLQDHSPQVLGGYFEAIAEDGNPYPYIREHFSLLLAAGKTLDAVLNSSSPGSFPIYDRRLFRSDDPSVEGAMLSRITFE